MKQYTMGAGDSERYKGLQNVSWRSPSSFAIRVRAHPSHSTLTSPSPSLRHLKIIAIYLLL